MGPDAMIFVFWMLSFKPTFSFSSFTSIKRLFSSSSLSAMRVISSSYLRLLTFLLGILIPACAYSSPAFLMMYSACKLNKQGDNIQPWCNPFPIWISIHRMKFYSGLKNWNYHSNILIESVRQFLSCWFWSPMSNSWRRQWHPTPVLLPGKSHGQRSLVGCSSWGH